MLKFASSKFDHYQCLDDKFQYCIFKSYCDPCLREFSCIQDTADEAKKKSDELLAAFEEVQKLLKEANEGVLFYIL